MLPLKPRPFVQSLFGVEAPRSPHAFLSFCSMEMSLFPSIFFNIVVFSWYGEYVVRSFLLNDAFLPCGHGLDFLHELIM